MSQCVCVCARTKRFFGAARLQFKQLCMLVATVTIKINYFCCIGISICASFLSVLSICRAQSDYVTHIRTQKQIKFHMHFVLWFLWILPSDIFAGFSFSKTRALPMPPAILTDFALKTPAASAAAAISFALKVQNQKSDCLYKSMGPWTHLCWCVCVCVYVAVYFWVSGRYTRRVTRKTSYYLWLIVSPPCVDGFMGFLV